MPTLLITHPACLQHLTPAGHPERPDRLRAIERALAHDRFRELVRVEAPAAALETLALCHPMQYVTAVRDATPKDGLIGLDADTTMSPGSLPRRSQRKTPSQTRPPMAAIASPRTTISFPVCST